MTVSRSQPHQEIRFRQGEWATLRDRLLADRTREAFCVLLARTLPMEDLEIHTVVAGRFPDEHDYTTRSLTGLGLRKDFIHDVLVEVQERVDVDTIIDVHTHPFSEGGVSFSGVDDADEEDFSRFLFDTFDDLNYLSIVLGVGSVRARRWMPSGRPVPVTVRDALERGTSKDAPAPFDRVAPVVGRDVLDALMTEARVAVIGLGGLGSVIAENLVHMGCQDLVLVDPDRLEPSNLGRVVGATYTAAARGANKVAVAKRHLRRINPAARIRAEPAGVEEEGMRALLSACTHIVVATDNHSSRLEAMDIALAAYVPLISAGVVIEVDDDGTVSEYSGEVVLVEPGGSLCLMCSGRLDLQRVAFERTSDPQVRAGLVAGGYVVGAQVAAPAVKTLNAMVGALATDAFVNAYTQRQALPPILVYESLAQPCIYPEIEERRGTDGDCPWCSVDPADRILAS